MQTLAPLIDQLVAISRAELPGRRTARIRLYDDHSYRVHIEHRYDGHDGKEAITYDRETGAVYWRDTAGRRPFRILDPVWHHCITRAYYPGDAERQVTTIEPPIDCPYPSADCGEDAAVDPTLKRLF